MMPWDVSRCTMSQIVAMLERPEGTRHRDPHAGQEPIRTAGDLEAAWEEWEEEFGG